MTFSAKLREARETAALTIAQAAAKIGVSPRTWAYWEDGKRLPPTESKAITRERLISNLKKNEPTK